MAQRPADAPDDGLPTSIPASLDISFELAPTEEDDAVLAGDWFSVALPEGVSYAGGEGTVPATSADDPEASADSSATPTDDLAATTDDSATSAGDPATSTDDPEASADDPAAEAAFGTVKDGVLRVELAADGALSAHLSLDVAVDAALATDEGSLIEWIVQTAEDGEQRTVELKIPSATELLALWGEPEGDPEAGDEAGGEADDEAEDDPAAAAPANALASRAAAPDPTRVPGTATESKTLTTNWADNNNASRPQPGDMKPTLTFTIRDQKGAVASVGEGGLIGATDGTPAEGIPATAENVRLYLGMTDAPSVSTEQTAVGTYLSMATGLPTEVVQTTWSQARDDDGNLLYEPGTGEPVYESSKTSYTVEWSLADATDYENYRRDPASPEGTQNLQLLTEVRFTITGKVGDESLVGLGDENNLIRVEVVVDNQVKGAYALEDLMQESTDSASLEKQESFGGAFGWDWEFDKDPNTVALFADLPQYTVDGRPIEYRLIYQGYDEDDDYYQATYDNSASANHGTVVDYAYPGGTIVFTHVGTTTFGATKQWSDGDNQSKRGNVTFSLWRYSDGATPGSIANASQVRAADGSFITVTVDPDDAADDGTVNLGDLLREQYPNLELDKYDSDGYPFVYGMREDTTLPDYEMLLDDTAPNYYDADGKTQVFYTDQNRDPSAAVGALWTRPDTDRLTYNGGTVENHLTGTKPVSQVKTWSVAAFQNQLEDVTCTFTLQQRRVGTNGEWTDAKDSQGAPVTQNLSGFNAEMLTQEITGSYPKYDEDGYELEYRWVETNVTQNGAETNFTRNSDGTATFTLSLESLEGSGDEPVQVEFTSQVDPGTGAIVNSFDNTTYENVQKLWQQPAPNDDQWLPSQPDPAREDEVTMRVYQGTTLVGEFMLDGQADDKASGFYDSLEGDPGDAVPSAQETDPYYLEITGLPLYSETGARYLYRVVEVEPAGWDSQRSYNAEQHLTTITNSYGPGEGTDFHLMKDWTDGEDSAHRLACFIDVRAKHDLYSTIDGTLKYQEGDVIFEGLALSEANGWFLEFTVPVNGLTTADIVVEETRLESLDGQTKYPVYLKTEAESAELGNEGWVNEGWTNPDRERVATDNHVYEVTYHPDQNGPFGKQTFTVNNRRLGLVDLTVEKKWLDGDASEGERPKARLELTVDDPKAVFSVDADGQAYAKLDGGNNIPLYDDANKPLVATVEDDGKALVINIDPAQKESTYGFFGLPKYKGIESDGEVVHYTVKERFVGASGDYASSVSVGEYKVGGRHFHDTQTYTVTNKRVGSTSATFHKEWKDVYVNEDLQQRPDIALTLYQVSAETGNKPKAVEGYIHYLWEADENREAGEGPDGDIAAAGTPSSQAASHYSQTCTISGLPKYDGQGDKITYYAVEEFMNDGASLGYGDVTFADDRMGVVEDSDPAVIKVKTGEAVADIDTAAGTDYALRSGGTFVNALSGNVVANGTKLWTNLPGSFPADDLPKITVFLQQKLASDEASWPALRVKWEGDSLVPVGNGAVAWMSQLTPAGNNQYSYRIEHTGDNTAEDSTGDALPLYDENGNLYEYRAREVMVGLLGTPGYIDVDEVGDVDFSQYSQDGSEDDDSNNSNKVFTIRHGNTGSFFINNVYDADKGKLTVKKLLDGRAAGDHYPDVEFVLYRQYETHNGSLSEAERVATGVIKADEFTAGEDSYTFEDLDIYAPNGQLWQYHVEEKSINGYTTSVGLGDLELGNAGLAGGPVSGSVEAADNNTVDVTFANAYDAEKLALKGTKEWNDYGNAFGTRPASIDLSLSRESASGQEEDVVLQGTSSTGEGYLTWTEIDPTDSTWEYSITGLEQWAPDGSAWTYTVKETLPSGETSYRVVTGSASGKGGATAGADGTHHGTIAALKNALKGSVTATKNWENDGDDEWGLRPQSVTVKLQAQYKKKGDADTSYSKWQSADEAFKGMGIAELPGGFPAIEQTLNESNNWRCTWSSVPMQVKGTNSTVYEVRYRVIETKVGDVEVASSFIEDSGNEVTYHTTASYDGKQTTTWTGDVDDPSKAMTSTTSITNTLDATFLKVTKAWNDESNKWGLRDKTTDEHNNSLWKVEYRLQRSNDNKQTWEWVGDETTLAIITGAPDVNEQTVTFENLPAKDADGNDYLYRAVEIVPGGYQVVNGTEVKNAEEAVVGSTVDIGTDGTSQTFTNSLYTTSLSGTKAWTDYGTGFAPKFGENDRPRMTIERSTDGKTWESAKPDIDDMPQPTWTANSNGTWAWSYSGLPEFDGDGKKYSYRVKEVAGSVGGFYPTYGNGSSAAGQDGTITNVATRFTLDKKNDWGVGETLNGIELAVMSTDGAATYAVWQRDANGTVTTWSNPSGVKTDEVWPDGTGSGNAKISQFTLMKDEAAGCIVGLKAGNYLVRETGAVPADHVRAQDVRVTLSASGALTSSTDGAVSTKGDLATVTMIDPVFRGYFTFAKALAGNAGAANAIAGATFDLYREGTGTDGADELMAQSLTTDKDGRFSSSQSDIEIVGKTDNRRSTLEDGLQAGSYYLLEKGTADNAHLPNGNEAKFPFVIDAEGNHGTNNAVTVCDNGGDQGETLLNDLFTATVTLPKLDGTSKEGIEGAVFELSYTPASGGTAVVTREKTDENGTLTLALSGKGTYTLTEVENTGYQVDKNFKVTFVLENEDHGKTFNLAEAGDRTILSATVEGEIAAGGLVNNRLTGSASLTKTSDDGTPLNGVVFSLQKKDADGAWNDVATSLETGKAYDMAARGAGDSAETGTASDAAAPDAGNSAETDAASNAATRSAGNSAETSMASNVAALDTDGSAKHGTASNTVARGAGDSADEGTLRVAGLAWGTYRFVETTPADGYVGQTGGTAVTSNEFTIDRTTVEREVALGTVENASTTPLTLRKTNIDGIATLSGAVFAVTPVEGSAFADGSTTARELTTGPDGTAALPAGQLVVGDQYDIAETTAPSGYEVRSGTLCVTVQADGALATVGEAPDGWSLDGAQASVTVTDQLVEAFVKKVDAADNKPLPGATFQVTGSFADSAEPVKTLSTNTDGLAAVTGLIVGETYAVAETASPAGYSLIAGTCSFTVDPDGTLKMGAHAGGYQVAGDGVTLTAADQQTRLALAKVAEDGQTPLAGATFQVTPADGSAFANGSTDPVTMQTDSDGMAELAGQLVVGGSYSIVEVRAPAGYELIKGTLSIEVADDGAILAKGPVPNGYRKDGANAFTVQVVNVPVVVGLQKVSSADYGTPLAGAVFAVEGAFADGSTEQLLTSDDQGLARLEALLVAGESYTVAEVVPAPGYKLIEGSFGFRVADDGTIAALPDAEEVADGSPGFRITPDGNVAIAAADAPIEARIAKTDSEGEPLAGAAFTVAPVEGGTFADGSTEPVEVVTGADGLASLPSALLAAGSAYEVAEVRAPAGYELAGSAVITVSPDGTFLLEDAQDGVAAGRGGSGRYAVSADADGVAVIQAVDEPVQASLLKTNTLGAPLEGATFQITGLFVGEDGPSVRTYETDAQGRILLVGELAAGRSYTVAETIAPEGYLLIEGSYTFSVQEDGTLLGPEHEGYAIVDGGVTLQAIDQKIPERLPSVSQDNPTPPSAFGNGGSTLTSTGDGSASLAAILGALAAFAAAACAAAIRVLRRKPRSSAER